MQSGSTGRFRPEIHGLRALAALLVAVYHIWFQRVSGGVDVFFIVSGFLITTSLVGQLDSSGRVDINAYFTRLAKRLLPAAMLVLLVTVAACLIWLPHTRWAETVGQAFAAALYFENWTLAFNAVDYLGREEPPSPMQHFWALSVQGQFYVAWALLAVLAGVLGGRLGRSPAGVFAGLVLLVLGLSFAHSVHWTATDQAFAYFDSFARAWQFAIGGVAALVLPRLQPRTGWRVVFGWTGLVAIIACGVVLDAGRLFPGHAALWPVGAAVLVLVAGTSGSRFGADRLLAWRPVQWLGGISYSLYLWHWPILVLFLAASGREAARTSHGAIILALALVLATLTTRLVENPVRFSRLGRRRRDGALLAAVCLLPVMIASGSWWWQIERQQRAFERMMIDELTHPGAMALAPDFKAGYLVEAELIPGPMEARSDKPVVYDQRCHQAPRLEELIVCRFGDPDGETTVALVGGSHSAHWLPALRRLAERGGLHIVSMTKSACRLGQPVRVGDPSCHAWNRRLMEWLLAESPDLVFTTATIVSARNDVIPNTYVAVWRRLAEHGIPVMALRDTPRMAFDVPECVERHGPDSPRCMRPLKSMLAPESPLPNADGIPDNVHLVDLTRYFCPQDVCLATAGNVLIYRDQHHLSNTYSRSLAPIIGDEIAKAVRRGRQVDDD